MTPDLFIYSVMLEFEHRAFALGYTPPFSDSLSLFAKLPKLCSTLKTSSFSLPGNWNYRLYHQAQ